PPVVTQNEQLAGPSQEVLPTGVVTITFRRPVAAAASTVTITCNVVFVPPVTVGLTPSPATWILAPIRLVPVIVTETEFPLILNPGDIPVIVGGESAKT